MSERNQTPDESLEYRRDKPGIPVAYRSNPMSEEHERPVGLEPMTEDEAKCFGNSDMTFGHYAGRRIDDVPIEYLTWLTDQSRTFLQSIHRYLNSLRIKREREE
jgi:uncharacterized protein (DUF3820 family)